MEAAIKYDMALVNLIIKAIFGLLVLVMSIASLSTVVATVLFEGH